MKIPRIKTVVLGLLATAALLYVAYGTIVFTVQRSILYKVQPARTPVGDHSIWLEADGAKVEARWSPTSDSTPLVGLFFHGNAEIIDDWPLSIEDWNRHGVSVLQVELPGYGHSTGAPPTEDRIRAVNEAAFDWVLSQGIPADHIFAAGRSLGGGLACDLSTTRPLAGLFLQSTFRSVRDRGSKEYHLPGFLVRDGYENTKILSGYTKPVLLIQGTEDARIPFTDLAILANAAPHAQKVVFQGYHHSDIPGKDTTLYWNSVDTFLADIRNGTGRR